MKQYLTTKHNWSEKTWSYIDTQIVKAYHNHKKIQAKNMWFKVAHNLHPLGERKQMMTDNSQSNIKIDTCPCCHTQLETQLHFFTCDSNPNRTAALEELTTGGSTYKENHNFVTIMTDCIEQWLYDPNESPSATDVACPTLAQYNTMFPPYMMSILCEAIAEQTEIGWVNLLQGVLLYQMEGSSVQKYGESRCASDNTRWESSSGDHNPPSTGLHPTYVERKEWKPSTSATPTMKINSSPWNQR
jgi:hypothetical protein